MPNRTHHRTHRAWPALSGLPRPALLTTVAAAALIALTACGSSDSGGGDAGKGGTSDDGVASIASPAAGGGSAKASADPDAGRPQIRLDTTQEEVYRMHEVWVACVEQKVGRDNSDPKGGSNPLWLKIKSNPADPNGPAKVCLSKLPLDPPELSPATNPKYADGVPVMVKCMNDHGIRSVTTDGGWGLADGAEMSRPNFDSALTGCQVKAWGGKN